uniref:Ribonuclease H-like domain-containing protein n=1 Tax=Tanacetum cinerariifolium TaxID=118510 RepID=A0A699HEY5_TANCI|nr:ribonuclease H-like domain-containing protein [Tanacetum cinerariifolium]
MCILTHTSTPLSIAHPSRAFNDGELSYLDDPSMPHLEDIYTSPSEGIFTDSSYDGYGVTRSKVNKNSEAHALFQIQKVWILVDFRFGKKAIGTKWIYMNKKDESGVVVRNKARLVAQGDRQEEGIDYDEKSWFDEFEELMKTSVKTASTPIETQKPLVIDKEADDVDISGHSKDFTPSGCEENLLFWKATTFKIVNNISQIHAKVAGKPVVITKASIRSDLLFNDVDGVDCLTNLEGTCGNGGDQVNLHHDSLLSGGYTSDKAEGSLNLEVLYALCTNLSNRVLALETVKDAQAKEILTLKAKIKKLEKRSVSLLSKKKKLIKKKSISKQERKNAKSGPTKDGSDKLDAELDEDMEYMDTEEGLNEGRQSTVSTARLDDDTATPDVSTTRQKLSIAGLTTTPTTLTISDDEEMTLADTLIKLKDDKAKGVAFKDSESTDRPARSILTLKPLPTIDPKDKGKVVLEEHESAKKMTKSDFNAAQISRDEEIARQLEVELQAELESKRHREEQASMDYIANLYDEVQARINADHELAVRWTHEEQENYTVDERAKLLLFPRVGSTTLNDKVIVTLSSLKVTMRETLFESANSSAGATQQLSSRNTSSLAVAKYSSSEIFITGSGNDLSILFLTILSQT